MAGHMDSESTTAGNFLDQNQMVFVSMALRRHNTDDDEINDTIHIEVLGEFETLKDAVITCQKSLHGEDKPIFDRVTHRRTHIDTTLTSGDLDDPRRCGFRWLHNIFYAAKWRICSVGIGHDFFQIDDSKPWRGTQQSPDWPYGLPAVVWVEGRHMKGEAGRVGKKCDDNVSIAESECPLTGTREPASSLSSVQTGQLKGNTAPAERCCSMKKSMPCEMTRPRRRRASSEIKVLEPISEEMPIPEEETLICEVRKSREDWKQSEASPLSSQSKGSSMFCGEPYILIESTQNL